MRALQKSPVLPFILSLYAIAIFGVLFVPLVGSPKVVYTADAASVVHLGTGSATPAAQIPTELSIPSISLDAPIEDVGLNSIGQMDVPDGRSNAVGWYRYGTVPGQMGSAVLDAHVYAAFSKLALVSPGSDIYVTVGGQQLHFVVITTKKYALADLSADELFNTSGARILNLITCAGAYLPSLGTYDQRLLVHAELESDMRPVVAKGMH